MSKFLPRAQVAALTATLGLTLWLKGSDLRFATHGADPLQLRFVVAFASLAILVAGLLVRRNPLPGSRAGRLALLGIASWTILTGLSILWSPVRESASSTLLLMLLYMSWLVAAIPPLRTRAVALSVEPLLAALLWIAAVVALTPRFAPALASADTSSIALGRLSEPLGYWNTSGALFGIGLVLAARLASGDGRSRLITILALAASPVLGAALWLTYSRGSLAATAAGLVALIALRRTRAQAVACAATFATAGCAALAAEAFPSVTSTAGAISGRESAGLGFAITLGVLSLASAAASWAWTRSAQQTLADPPHAISRFWVRLATFVAVALLALPLATVLLGQGTSSGGGGSQASRLASTETNRTQYWSVALDQFTAHPVIGDGASSFGLRWEGQRGSLQPAHNAHSLELETLGELGLLGAGSLLLFFAGLALSSRAALRKDPVLTTGPCAVLVLALSHSFVDWDWQLPGFVLTVLMVAAVPLAALDPGPDGRAHAPSRAALALLAAASTFWFWHSWHALQLQREASTKIEAATILGWSPRRYAETEKLLRDATWLNPDPSPQILLVNTESEAGHTTLAVEEATRLTNSNPEYWLAWQIRSNAELAAGQLTAAARSKAKSLALLHASP